MENKITITDSEGSKKTVSGCVGGFVVKKPERRRKQAVINGFDTEWIGKPVLCVLLENVNEAVVAPAPRKADSSSLP